MKKKKMYIIELLLLCHFLSTITFQKENYFDFFLDYQLCSLVAPPFDVAHHCYRCVWMLLLMILTTCASCWTYGNAGRTSRLDLVYCVYIAGRNLGFFLSLVDFASVVIVVDVIVTATLLIWWCDGWLLSLVRCSFGSMMARSSGGGLFFVVFLRRTMT